MLYHELKLIQDEDNNNINFNGVDWYLTLTIIFSYKKQDINPPDFYEFLDNTNAKNDTIEYKI